MPWNVFDILTNAVFIAHGRWCIRPKRTCSSSSNVGHFKVISQHLLNFTISANKSFCLVDDVSYCNNRVSNMYQSFDESLMDY